MSVKDQAGLGGESIKIVNAANNAETVPLPRNFATGRLLSVRRIDHSGYAVTVTVPTGHKLDDALDGTAIVLGNSYKLFVQVDPGEWESFGASGSGSGGAVTSVAGLTGDITDSQIVSSVAVAAALAGKLSSSATATDASKVGGVTITGTPSTGWTPVASSATAAAWTAPSPVTDTSAVHVTGSETIAGTKTFSSSPVVPTPSASGHASTKAYVDSVASTGTPDADASTKGKVQLTGDLGGTAASPTVPGLAAKAPLASPALTGTPTAPTASAGTSTTQLATTAFVAGQASNATPLVNGTAAAGNSSNLAREGHVHPTDTSRAAAVETVTTITGGTAATLAYGPNRLNLNSPACTVAFPTATPGTSLTVLVAQDATGGRTVTWPGTIVWIGTGNGAAPTLAAGASKYSLCDFYCNDAGYWIGTFAGTNA